MEEKIKKLHAVIGDAASSENEKQIARNILEKYAVLGHNIEITDKRDWKVFPFKGGPRNKEKFRFLITILQNLMNDEDMKGISVLNDSAYNVELKLTEAEHIEILARFEFYWRDYQEKKKEHEEIFRRAYIGKNNLWAKPDEKEKDDTPPTKEEIARDMKARAVRETFDRAEYHKRIGAANP